MKRMGLVGLVLLLSTGCSAATGDANPNPSPSPETSEAESAPIVWQPCDEFAPEELAAAGLKYDGDESSRITSTNPQLFGCIYFAEPTGSAPAVTVSAWASSVEDAIQGRVLQESLIGKYRLIATEDALSSSCLVVVGVDPGVLTFRVGWTPSPPAGAKEPRSIEEACGYAMGYAAKLAPAFPDQL